MVLKFFLLASIFLFTSCSDLGERDNPDDPDGINYQGGEFPSSSSGSTQTGIIYGDPIYYDGETYETVVIGTQTWFKRNLNYAAPDSKCGNGSSLSDANTTTCNTYGRLYNWATAMALDASCNSSTCASKINAKHRGICPDGWHIPSNADWDKLVRYVDGSTGTSSPYDSPTAGRYLKATNGWNSNGNGQDKYGFSALPGYSDGSFYYVGYSGNWWSASERNANYAYYRSMVYDGEFVRYESYGKSLLYSVRCLQD